MLPKVSPSLPLANSHKSLWLAPEIHFKEKGNSEQEGQPQSHLHPISASDQHMILGKSFPHSVPQS